MNTVLIAHYNRPLDWINSIKSDVNVVIYSTADCNINFEPFKIPKIFIPNKGMDAGMYIKYIIDNYTNLPERILFCHHHEYDWTQEYALSDMINRLKWDCDKYFNIGKREWYSDAISRLPKNEVDILRDNWYIFEKHISFPKMLYFYAGTQFCCHKDLILQYPLEYWQYLYDWIQTTPLIDFFSGRMFEYAWHYLLTKNSIDQKKEYKDFLI